VLDEFNKPYIPRITPPFGPVFDRQAWKINFQDNLLNSRMYHVYFGASGGGKSVAISDALKQKYGVIHVPLRNSLTNQAIWEKFADSIGYFGSQKRQNSSIDPSSIYKVFLDAASFWKKETKNSPVLIVEDIHSVKSREFVEFAASLVEIYSRGEANVVFTVSDYSMISELRSVSGHSSRLRWSLFPDVPDEDLEKQLLSLYIKEKVEKNVERELVIEPGWEDVDLGTWRESPKHNFILVNESDVKLIVKSIGSHMEDLLTLISDVINNPKVPVQKLIDEIVEREVPNFASIFVNEPINPVLVLTADRIFRDLEKKEQVNIFNVINDFPQITFPSVNTAVKQLVEKNLLTFVNDETVRSHARRCLGAFQIVKKRGSVLNAIHLSKEMINPKKN